MDKFIKKIIFGTLAISTFSLPFASANSQVVPATMEPYTVIECTEDGIIQTTEIPDSKYKQDRSVMTYDEDTSGREEEDFLVAQAMEEAKNYPTYYSDLILPEMIPGMKVTYGSDGHINHITVDGEEYEVEYEITKITNGISDTYRQPNTTIIVNRTGKGVGTWPWGITYNNQVVVTSTSVTGTGRGTVYDDKYGDHDVAYNTPYELETGDCATKGSYDNPQSGTKLQVRNLDNDIVKTLTKNDNGRLPDAVIDIWKWSGVYFGETYNSNLSFPNMRYYYQYAK